MNKLYEYLSKTELSKCHHIKLNKDETLFYENDECKEIGIVKKGHISISSFTYQGQEIIFNDIYDGMMFGNNLIFSSDNLYKGNVIAKSNSEVLLISKNVLLEILHNNEQFLLAYLANQSEFAKSLNNKIKTLSFNKASDRLLFYLSSHNNVIKIKSITSFASTLNISREVLSRMISRLIKENRIIYQNKTIILINQ